MTASEAASPASVAGAGLYPVRYYVALVAGVLCISITAILTRLAVMPGPVVAAWRMTIAAIALSAILLLRSRRAHTGLSLGRAKWAILGGIWFAFNLGLLNTALTMTSAANATLLDNTAPVWVGLGAMIFFREKLGRRYWLGLALAVAGAGIVTGWSLAGSYAPGAGDVVAFAGAFFYAGYLLTIQRARRQLDTLSTCAVLAVTASLVLLGACLALDMPLLGYHPRSYLAVLVLGLVSQTGGWLLINYALGYLPASSAVIVLLAQPALTGLLAIPILGEALTSRQALGGLLALVGVYLCLRPGAAKPPG